MNISLDFDDTFTKDPQSWMDFCQIMRNRGHTIYGVTMRYPEECGGPMFHEYTQAVNKVIPTSRAGKYDFTRTYGINIDVWIDDRPDFILMDAVK